MKNKNKIIPIFVLFLSLLFSVNLISAADGVAVHAPTLQYANADECIVGTVNLNGNFANNSCMGCDASLVNVTQASFYYRIGADDWTLIGTNSSFTNAIFNTTLADHAVNFTWDSTGIIDDTDVDFNVTLRNSTTIFDSGVITDAHVCNTDPVATFTADSLAVDKKIYAGSATTINFSVEVDTNGIDNCTIKFTNTATQLVTATSNSCSTMLAPSSFGFGSADTISYIITVYDGNGNSTNTSSRNILLYPGTGVSAGAGQGGGVSPGSVQEAGTPTTQVETPSISGEKGLSPTTQETIKNIGQKVSNAVKKMIDFFKNIFGKKS